MNPLSLFIAVRYHEGRYYGENDGFDGTDGWPPSPGRLFQALVAAAAVGKSIDNENKRALEWLENLDPPKIVAPAARVGRAVKLYVPNNDLDSVGGDPKRISEIRVEKKWRPHFFDCNEPVIYIWDFDSGRKEAEQICLIATQLYQLGKGIDMAAASGEVIFRNEAEQLIHSHSGRIRRPSGKGTIPTPHSGTLDSLVGRYKLKRQRLSTRFVNNKPHQEFSQPPKASFRRIGYDDSSHSFLFDFRNPQGDFTPRPLASAATLVNNLRKSACQRLQESLPEYSKLFDRIIVGRDAGVADLVQRIRLIPIPSIGTQFTDPSIRRLVVEIPPNCPVRTDDLNWAFSGLQLENHKTGEKLSGRLVSTEDSQMLERYIGPSMSYCSITPVALSGFFRQRFETKDNEGGNKKMSEERIAYSAVIQALRHAGINASPVELNIQREPFTQRHERAETFAIGTRFPKNSLWHVAVTFSEPVTGPLLIGNGRFLGLGLMYPYESTPGIEAFAIKAGLSDSVDPALITQAARRAMMARVQEQIPSGYIIPTYVSGHHEDGSVARDGTHRHISVVADLAQKRILFIAPNWLQRNGITWHQVQRDHSRLHKALVGMNVLRAGVAGKLSLSSTVVNLETDTLFAPAQIWESVTDFHVTRYRQRTTKEEALKADALAELQRCGWPTPKCIRVLSVQSGPRLGLSGRLRISFVKSESGPLLLGRTIHKGGGLFRGCSI